MRLIGMLDSPYVRRVAVSLNFFGLAYEHEALSVFRNYDAFAAINPVVKAPTLVTDEGVILTDSALILEYLDRLAPQERRLAPADLAAYARAQRIVGLALVANEKTVQIVYEHNRPVEKRHQPWLDRVREQLRSAYRLLETEFGGGEDWLFEGRPLQADISTAIAWRFTREIIPAEIAAADYPALSRLSARAEALPEFIASPAFSE